MTRELNFDGLVGPTHNYGGLSPGNVASTQHGGQVSNPRRAALAGLEKMRFVRDLGVPQAVLPPHLRPRLRVLRALGFHGSDEQVLAAAAAHSDHMVRKVSSAAAMWTANAATVAPSSDTADGRLHLTPANLQQMFHRAIEADTTERVLRAIFSNAAHFQVHSPLPGGGQYADEGAANHTRLVTDGHDAVHIFAWGRRSWGTFQGPAKHPARQTLEASSALARLHQIAPARALFPQQHPDGIDAGAFHTDVMAVGNESFMMMHELAFVDGNALRSQLRNLLGESLHLVLATSAELPAESAVASYAFNSQVVTLPDGRMAIIAPIESQERADARAFLSRVVAEDNPVSQVCYLDLRDSMHNGGGPACLRLRVRMTPAERQALGANVITTDALLDSLKAWVTRHYRDQLTAKDLGDPALMRESMTALDELTQILKLGSVYDFQEPAGGAYG